MPFSLASEFPFIKMHGLGNNFILLAHPKMPSKKDPTMSSLAWTLCHPKMGIGADGLVVYSSLRSGGAGMSYWNADGSWAEQCVNALRCVALYHHHQHYQNQPLPSRFSIKTAVGSHAVRVWENGEVLVVVGSPKENPRRVSIPLQERWGPQVPENIEGTWVSMGNPHLILESTGQGLCQGLSLGQLGPWLEKHPLFPEGVNVTMAEVHRPDGIQACTWERGVGFTLACGSAACAVMVALASRDLCDSAATIRMPGGDLQVSWPSSNAPVTVQAKASFVCKGTWMGEEVPRFAPPS